jgi:ABC-2 type transport system ATP-binding protein
MTFALEISNLKKVYKGGTEALKGIDLKVKEGDFFALLGPNGAGKSSTIGIIGSLVNKPSGQVKIFDIDIDENFPEAKRLLGVVSQEVNFGGFEKVLDIVVTQGGFYGIPAKDALIKAESVMRRLGLWDKRSDQARTLSGGYKRRLMIAKALIHEPKLLILDEPTAGVDIELRREMWEFLREINANGTTIILTTHYLEEAEQLCKNIAIIDHGRIVKNTSIRKLLNQLNRETFVLEIRDDVDSCPEVEGYPLTLTEGHILEVSIEKSQSINGLFTALTEQGIHVLSMRNKTNRLEELFFDLVQKNLQEKSNG